VSTESKMRDDFEVWAADWGAMGAHHKAVAWDAYQAGRAAKAQEVPEGFALVPIEPTEEMVVRGAQSQGATVYYREVIAIYRAMLAAVRGSAHE